MDEEGDGPSPARRGRWALAAAGRVLAAAGLLVLLFVGYQLWGTTLVEIHHQAVLRSELAGRLPRRAGRTARSMARRATRHRRGPGAAWATAPSAAPASAPSSAPAAAPATTAPATGRPVGTIDIPSIDLDQVVVEGVGPAELAMGPGHYPGTALPGQAGNAAIAGHRTTYGHPFYDLDAVPVGGAILVTTPQGVFVYRATGTAVVPPTDVSVLDPTAAPQLTLTTCNPRYSAATRLVLHATLVASSLFGPPGGRAAAPGRRGGAPPPDGAATGAGPARPEARPARAAPPVAGTGPVGGWGAVVRWGLVLASLVAVTWAAHRRLRRRLWRRAAVLCSVPLLVVVLYAWFGALGAVLPPSM